MGVSTLGVESLGRLRTAVAYYKWVDLAIVITRSHKVQSFKQVSDSDWPELNLDHDDLGAD